MAGGEGEAATVMARIFVERYTMAGANLEERRRLGRRLARKPAVKHARFVVHFLAANHQTLSTMEARRESAEEKEIKRYHAAEAILQGATLAQKYARGNPTLSLREATPAAVVLTIMLTLAPFFLSPVGRPFFVTRLTNVTTGGVETSGSGPENF